MATATATTQQIVRGYHEAWTGPNVESAGKYIADGFITRAPVGSYDSREEYLAGLANFRNQFVTGVDLIAQLYSGSEAMLLYDVHTNTPAATIRTAEYFKLTEEKHPGDKRVMSALEAVARSPYEETQHILAIALEAFWAVPCRSAAGGKVGRGRARCIHERGFEALEAMVARLRLGPWDNATERRPRVVFAKPVLKSIAASKGDDVAFHEMGGTARALDVCARSASCVAEQALELLHALVELHARGWLSWGRTERYVDTRATSAVHGVAAGRVLDGDAALQTRLRELYRDDPGLLAAWAEALPKAAVDDARQRALTELWPSLMDHLIVALEAKTEGRGYRDKEALLESLIPIPPPGIDLHRWPTAGDLNSRIRALIDARRDPRVLANRLVWFLSGQPLPAQLDRGLDWFLEIVDEAEAQVAGRTRLGRWLRTMRDEHAGPLSSKDRSKWQRLVDALAAAGDEACVRLQQEEE